MARRILKILLYILGVFFSMLLLLLIYFIFAVKIASPDISFYKIDGSPVKKLNDSVWAYGENRLQNNKNGNWELHIQGNPYQLGVAQGKLAEKLIYQQEKAFTSEIKKMVPSGFTLFFLKYFVAWFNRDIDTYIPKEFLAEIYGVSKYASPEFSSVGPAYQRMLNYHAAHDIGHTVQSMHLVGCTSFALKDSATKGGTMLIGRNFDFTAGDEFARNKIICFCKPDKGYKFAYITWGGMIGVVSGMNEKGLTVTINAGPTKMPHSSAMPVTILAREILQYASTIDQAYAIAAKRKTMVSETFLIGSAIDKRAAIIEKMSDKLAMYAPNTNRLICTNHFQSKALFNIDLNKEAMQKTATWYRYKRVEELLNVAKPLDYSGVANILRDKQGLGNISIGLGNEKTINQLIAHHSIIFKPEKLIFWISTYPYQLGKYTAYDLNTLFNLPVKDKNPLPVANIPADPFFTNGYSSYMQYQHLTQSILFAINNKQKLPEKDIALFGRLNPDYYNTWFLIGQYYQALGKYDPAIGYYQKALVCETPITLEKEKILLSINKCKTKMIK